MPHTGGGGVTHLDNDTRLLCCSATRRFCTCARARAHVHEQGRTCRVDETRKETEGRVRTALLVARVGGGGEVLSSDVINALARLELSRVEAGVTPANCFA